METVVDDALGGGQHDERVIDGRCVAVRELDLKRRPIGERRRRSDLDGCEVIHASIVVATREGGRRLGKLPRGVAINASEAAETALELLIRDLRFGARILKNFRPPPAKEWSWSLLSAICGGEDGGSHGTVL